MRCSEVRDLLSEYLDGILSEQEAALMRNHLLRCPECRTDCEDLRKTLNIVHRLPRQEPVFELWKEFAPGFAEVRAEMKMGPIRIYLNRILTEVREGWVIFVNGLRMNLRRQRVGS